MGVGDDERQMRTETFSNAHGWTAIRVTHQPTGTAVERARTELLRSAVQAQRECIDEIRRRLAHDTPDQELSRGTVEAEQGSDDEWVTRREFDALVTRVAELERLAGLDDRT